MWDLAGGDPSLPTFLTHAWLKNLLRLGIVRHKDDQSAGHRLGTECRIEGDAEAKWSRGLGDEIDREE
jgi:hypothetical protein